MRLILPLRVVATGTSSMVFGRRWYVYNRTWAWDDELVSNGHWIQKLSSWIGMCAKNMWLYLKLAKIHWSSMVVTLQLSVQSLVQELGSVAQFWARQRQVERLRVIRWCWLIKLAWCIEKWLVWVLRWSGLACGFACERKAVFVKLQILWD